MRVGAYQDLFELAPDIYLVTDLAGVIREANAAAAALLNIRPQFLAGKPLRSVVETAPTKTLASKLHLGAREVYRRFGSILEAGQGPRKGPEVKVGREGRPPLVARWGGISLASLGRGGSPRHSIDVPTGRESRA
jgi:PAS domain-containing protein